MKLSNLTELQDYGEEKKDTTQQQSSVKPVSIIPQAKSLASPVNYKPSKTGRSYNPTAIKEHLLSKGLSEHAVKGILGNIQRESNFNSKAVGDGNTSIGLFQHHADRAKKLGNYLKLRGKDLDDGLGQVDYAYEELKSMPKVMKMLNSAKSPAQAADIWVRHFERPANVNNESRIRQQYAMKYKFGGIPKYKLGYADFSSLGSSLGQVVDNTQNEENPSNLGGFASGALKWGSAGLSTGNPIIAGAAGLVGGIAGVIQAKKKKKDFQEKQLQKLGMFKNQMMDDSNMRYQQFNQQSINSLKTYAKGGSTQPVYEAEDKEVIVGQDVQGNTEQVASNIHEVQGKTHDEYNPNSINGTGEDIQGGDFVFSDSLTPNGKQSFAELAFKIGKQKGKNEIKLSKMKGTDYIFKNTYRANIQKADNDIQQLAQIQEVMKQQQGITNTGNQGRFGGIIKMVTGGNPRENEFFRKLLDEGKKPNDLLKLGYDKKTVFNIVQKYNNNRDRSINSFPLENIDTTSNSWSGITDGIVDLKKQEVKLPSIKKDSGFRFPFSLNNNNGKHDREILERIEKKEKPKKSETEHKLLRYGEKERNERLTKEEANKKPNKINYSFSDYFLYGKKTDNQTPIDYLLYGKKGKDGNNKTTFIPYKDGSGTFQRKGFPNSRWMYDKDKKQYINVNVKAKSEKTEKAESVVTNDTRPDIRTDKKGTGSKFDVDKAFSKLDSIRDNIKEYDKNISFKPVESVKSLQNKQIKPFSGIKTPNVSNMKNVIDNVIKPKDKEKTGFGKVGLEQAGIFANYLSNRTGINKMKTDVPVQLQDNPDYMYRDSTGLQRQNVKSVFNSIANSPYSTQASKQESYGRTLDALNQVQDQENNRLFGYNQTYNQNRFATKQFNNQMINNARLQEIQNQNQQKALQLENNNNLSGNLNTYQREQNDLMYKQHAMNNFTKIFADKSGMSLDETKKALGYKFGGFLNKKKKC